MKKFLTALVLCLIPLNAFAFDDTNLTLKKGEAYMLFIDERPVNMVVSEPKVLSVQTAADLYNVSQHLVIRTYSTGESNIVITTNKKNVYTVKVKVENDSIVSNEVFEIDLPPGV